MRRFLRSALGIATLVAISLWLLGVGDVVDHPYWNTVYKLQRRPASAAMVPGGVVIICVDNMQEAGAFGEAQLLDAIHRQNPARVYFDARILPGSSPADLGRLIRSFRQFGDRLAFVARAQKFDRFDPEVFRLPPALILGHSPVVVSGWNVNFMFYAESSPYAVDLGGISRLTLAAALAGRGHLWARQFNPDFSIDPATIPRMSGRELMTPNGGQLKLQGKQVIVSSGGQAPAGYFGHGSVMPAALDVAGAAAIARPLPYNLTMLPLLAFVLVLSWAGYRSRRNRIKAVWYSGAVLATILLPVVVRQWGLVIYPGGAMTMLAVFGAIRLWQRRTWRIQQTSLAGLPNMLALTRATLPVGRDVIVAAIARYEEILATLPHELHAECARQIARRISVGSGTDEIYHADGGHFAWTEEARPLESQMNHLEGLRALFSAPMQIGPHTFDTHVHFGLDRNEGVDPLTRVNSALASANEAVASGRAIELFEAHRLAEAPWELSLHARIDEGLRNGDIWLAFQSQWDVRSRRICGAEALIRWNHPTRGPIAPDAFILQAERAGRIDALTYWVMENAITAALVMNARGERFQMSINLSGQMVDKPDLVRNFAEIVERRGIDPRLLTIEVTETSSLRDRPAACQNLTMLREMGFRLSIDDFGTGEASLTYLADLPSDELKIDRRFISRVVDRKRDRTIVASMIDLAHALGQSVVAEGIEDAATFAVLHELGCDFAQGYHLGRPQPFAIFERAYHGAERQEVGR